MRGEDEMAQALKWVRCSVRLRPGVDASEEDMLASMPTMSISGYAQQPGRDRSL